MKTHTLTTLFVIALILAACQPATFIPPTDTPTPEPPTSTPTITPTPTVGPGGFPRRFLVEGNAFVDQFGQKMIFRGISSMDPVQLDMHTEMYHPTFNEKYYQVMASWGANIVRVPIVPSILQSYGMDQVLRSLDQAIAWAGDNKIYVIITFYSTGWLADGWFPPGAGSETSVEEWTDVWQKISSRYADNDVVAFYELYHEPAVNPQSNLGYTRDTWLIWKGLVDPLINYTIRPKDPDKIVLVGGLQSGYDLSYVANAPIADISNNVAYGTEPMAALNTDLIFHTEKSDWDTAFGNLSSQYPVFATELGYGDGVAPDPKIGNIPYHQAIIDYLEEHSISWTVIHFSGSWAPRLLKSNETFEPSESGAYFRSRLLELNFPGGMPPDLVVSLPTLWPTPIENISLATGKPVMASSIEVIENLAENAVDGDLTTRWASAYSDPQWIQVDLGAIYHINRVALYWEASYGVAYEIQISSNGSDWTTVYSTTNGDGQMDDLSVSGSGRYVRMYGTERVVLGDYSFGYSLYEFEVYGVP